MTGHARRYRDVSVPAADLPDPVLEEFLRRLDQALDLAAAGRVQEGCGWLAAGLEDALTAGEPWAPELARRYRGALRHYRELWHGL